MRAAAFLRRGSARPPGVLARGPRPAPALAQRSTPAYPRPSVRTAHLHCPTPPPDCSSNYGARSPRSNLPVPPPVSVPASPPTWLVRGGAGLGTALSPSRHYPVREIKQLESAALVAAGAGLDEDALGSLRYPRVDAGLSLRRSHPLSPARILATCSLAARAARAAPSFARLLPHTLATSRPLSVHSVARVAHGQAAR